MARKPYARGRASQELILDTALETIGRKGFGATSLADIASQVGMTPAGLLHHFGSKENLFVEVLRRRDDVDRQRLGGPGEDDLPLTLRIARHNVTVPGLIQLYVNLAAAAENREHPAHEYFRERYTLIRHRVTRDIEIRQHDGRFDPHADASKIATMLIALSDGLQAQWAIDPSVDLFGTLLTFWKSYATTDAEPLTSAKCNTAH